MLEVRNDGVTAAAGVREVLTAPARLPRRPAGSRHGLRLATLEALQHGGVLEYGESEPGAWQVRLVVPTGQ